MRKLVIALAALVTATTASALPLAGVDLSGTYFRDGVGFNATKGGPQAEFQLPNTDFKSRLGNENNSYLEINFADTMFKSDDGVEMKYVFMPAIGGCSGNQYGNCLGGTSLDSKLYVQQSFGLVKMPQLGGADLWIGQRYYQRHNIDNYDWFWWNVFQGHGAAGIENVDLGAGKLSFAIGRIQPNATSTATGPTDSYVVPDIRFVTIPFIPNGTIEVGVDLALSTGKGLPANHSTVSPWFTAIYTQGGVLGGDNFIGFQYATAAFANMNDNMIVGANSDVKQWRVFDQLVYHPVPEFSGELAVAYQSKTVNAAGDGLNIFNAQIRPSYHFSNYFKLETDFWYSMTSLKNAPSGTSNPSLFKATVAPTLVAGQSGGLWARPEFRVFATYATWSNVPTGSTVAGGAFGTDTNGLTLGAQVEAWW